MIGGNLGGHLGGHLGDRVSALLDGQLDPRETERAWAHVHACHLCRDQVEREGWVKTRLAGLGSLAAGAPDDLKGALVETWSLPPGEAFLAFSHEPRPRRGLALAALGGGAAGAAMMGLLALGAAPADAPTLDRPRPATSLTQPVPGLPLDQARREDPDRRPGP